MRHILYSFRIFPFGFMSPVDFRINVCLYGIILICNTKNLHILNLIYSLFNLLLLTGVYVQLGVL